MEIVIGLAVLGGVIVLVVALAQTLAGDPNADDRSERPEPPRGSGNPPISLPPPRKRMTERASPPVASTASTDDGFLTSAAIGYATDNGLLGGLLGGNIAGGIVGDMLNNSTPEPTPSAPSYDPQPQAEAPDVHTPSDHSAFDAGSSFGGGSVDSGSSFDSGSSDCGSSGSFD